MFGSDCILFITYYPDYYSLIVENNDSKIELIVSRNDAALFVDKTSGGMSQRVVTMPLGPEVAQEMFVQGHSLVCKRHMLPKPE